MYSLYSRIYGQIQYIIREIRISCYASAGFKLMYSLYSRMYRQIQYNFASNAASLLCLCWISADVCVYSMYSRMYGQIKMCMVREMRLFRYVPAGLNQADA